MESRLWVNGSESISQLVPDEGLFFGRGVFETIRVGETPWFLRAHLNRLSEGAAVMGIPMELTEEAVLAFVGREQIRNCAMKITLTPRNQMMTTRPMPYCEETLAKGLRVMLGEGRRNPYSLLVGVKTTAYAENILERERSVACGCTDAILCNVNGMLAEGTATNLFWVHNGVLHTPATSCGLLPGIVRGFVLDHFDVVEGSYPLDALLEADEAFLTNSLMGIAGIRELLGHRTYPIGPVTGQVREAYKLALEELT